MYLSPDKGVPIVFQVAIPAVPASTFLSEGILMPTHQHKFKCRKCGYFVIETDSFTPPPNRQHALFSRYKLIQEHLPIWRNMQIERRRIEHCLLYVQYVGIVTVHAAVRDLRHEAFQRVLAAARCGRNPPAMVAVMYDTVSQRWFVGHTGRGTGQGLIPAAIWNTIPTEINADSYRFGRTCAEVDCLRQAYANRQPGDQTRPLESSVFAAYSPLERRFRPPCMACARWIGESGGVAV